MSESDSSRPFNMIVTYIADTRTGAIELLINYESPPGTRLERHEDLHFQRVQQLLERSGLLREDQPVRIQRRDWEMVYNVKSEGGQWQWGEISHRELPSEEQRQFTRRDEGGRPLAEPPILEDNSVRQVEKEQ
jgi:hypothetical protein